MVGVVRVGEFGGRAASVLIDRVYLAPKCAYSTRRAVIDVTERFGLSKKLVAEGELDLAPFDRVEADQPSGAFRGNALRYARHGQLEHVPLFYYIETCLPSLEVGHVRQRAQFFKMFDAMTMNTSHL